MSVSFGKITLDSGLVIFKDGSGDWCLKGAELSCLLSGKYGFERAIFFA